MFVKNCGELCIFLLHDKQIILYLFFGSSKCYKKKLAFTMFATYVFMMNKYNLFIMSAEINNKQIINRCIVYFSCC